MGWWLIVASFKFLFASTSATLMLSLILPSPLRALDVPSPGSAASTQPERSRRANEEILIEITDWKEPPSNIPWSKIVTIKSAFETYRAVWDQDYKGRSCFLSCNFYDGLISRWTGDQLAVAEFSTYCFGGNCRKSFKSIPYGVELSINGEQFSLSGSDGLFALNSKVRRALEVSPENTKISLRLGGNHSVIYNIGDASTKSIKSLILQEASEDKSAKAGGAVINLTPAIKRSELVQPVVKRTLPGVAEISTPRGKGTGFLIDSKGLLLTNRHVVGRFPEVDVRFNDGKTLRAKVIGRTSDLDIALLQLQGTSTKPNYPALPLCLSKAATVGEDIVVIGNPLGLQATTTRGIVSGVRDEDGSTMLQIDAPVNPGNSGGPIVNYNGEVIGIVTAKMVALGVEGIGFGISLPSALESLGIKVKAFVPQAQSKVSASGKTKCGNDSL